MLLQVFLFLLALSLFQGHQIHIRYHPYISVNEVLADQIVIFILHYLLHVFNDLSLVKLANYVSLVNVQAQKLFV